jgi:hypothetical protein
MMLVAHNTSDFENLGRDRIGGNCVQLLDTLNEINERHEAVKELNKSLLELHQMFLDMAVLVEQQGVMLDNIEKQARLSVSPCWLTLCRYFRQQASDLPMISRRV